MQILSFLNIFVIPYAPYLLAATGGIGALVVLYTYSQEISLLGKNLYAYSSSLFSFSKKQDNKNPKAPVTPTAAPVTSSTSTVGAKNPTAPVTSTAAPGTSPKAPPASSTSTVGDTTPADPVTSTAAPGTSSKGETVL